MLFPKLPKGGDYDQAAFRDLVQRMLDMVCSEEERDDPDKHRDGYEDRMLCGGSESCISPLGVGGFASMKALCTADDLARAITPATRLIFLNSPHNPTGAVLSRADVQAIGRLDQLPERCQKQLHRAIEETSENSGLTLILALSYGSREEIVDGVKSVVRAVREGHIDEAMITPDLFGKHLYTRYYPDPDLLIRTSGEMRVSNFLLWQISYAEMYITRTLWPDFRHADLNAAVEEYARRNRRFGGL